MPRLRKKKYQELGLVAIIMPRLRKKTSKATKPEITRNTKSSETTKGGPELLLPKKWIKTPRKKTFLVDMENIESLESNQGDSIFDFIPSKTTRSKIDDADQEHVVTKNIHVHIQALRRLITASFKFVRNYEFLISSAEEVLRMVDCFIKDTRSPRFNWSRRAYEPPLRPKETYPLNASSYDCNLAKDGRASVYPDSPRIARKRFLPFALPELVSSKKVPLCFCLPLNTKEIKIWREFRELDKGNPESLLTNSTFYKEEEKRSINLSYPLVGVIGGFAVAAFNKACARIKKDDHNNLHDFEYMECKYVKGTEDYFFYMTVEAIEEGNLGVYEAIVVCNKYEGVRTLLKFVLTNRTPVGSKAMALSFLSRLRSLCKTLEHVVEEKATQIWLIHSNTTRMQRGAACYEMILLEDFDRYVMKGIRRVLSLNLQLLFQPNCTRRSAPDDWSLPDDPYDIGMVPRNNGKPCRGYDYDHYNQYLTSSQN